MTVECPQVFIIEAANGNGGAICPAGAEFGLGVAPGAHTHTENTQLTYFIGGVSASLNLNCLESTYGPGIDELEIYLQSTTLNAGLSDLPCEKTLDVVLSVVDPSGGVSSSLLHLQVRFYDIRPPQLDSPLNTVYLPCGNTTALAAPVAFDGCTGPVTGTTDDPVIYSQEGEYTVTWDFNDGCGNISHYTQEIIVGEQTPPTINCGVINPVRNTSFGHCHYVAQGTEFEPAFADNCGATLYTPYSQSDNLDGAFFEVGTTAVTWTATDAAGHNASCTVYIQINDGQNPTAICKDITVPLSGFGVANILAADINNGSYDNCGIGSLSASRTQFDCSDIGPNTVTLTATDINGRTANCQSTVTITGDEDCEVSDCINGLNAQGFPCGWTTTNNGISCNGGNKASFNAPTNTFTLQADGCYSANASADESGFISYDLCGSGQLTAHVAGLTLPGYAGIVMRETSAPGAKKVALVYQGSNVLQRYARYTNNGASYPSLIPTAGSRWLRIVRTGNIFKGYHSFNGSTWSFAFTVTVPMQSCIKIGLIAYGPNGASSVTAGFDHVSVVGGNPLKPNAEGQESIYSDPNELMLWPNPVTGQATLTLNESWGRQVTVRVLDGLGRQVRILEADAAAEPDVRLEMGDRAQGVYWVKVRNEEGRSATLRMVVVRE